MDGTAIQQQPWGWDVLWMLLVSKETQKDPKSHHSLHLVLYLRRTQYILFFKHIWFLMVSLRYRVKSISYQQDTRERIRLAFCFAWHGSSASSDRTCLCCNTALPSSSIPLPRALPQEVLHLLLSADVVCMLFCTHIPSAPKLICVQWLVTLASV